MIKVLSKGKRYNVKCGACNSLLEYGIEDVIVEETEPYFDPEFQIWRGTKIYLKCPVCDHYIPKKELTPYQ